MRTIKFYLPALLMVLMMASAPALAQQGARRNNTVTTRQETKAERKQEKVNEVQKPTNVVNQPATDNKMRTAGGSQNDRRNGSNSGNAANSGSSGSGMNVGSGNGNGNVSVNGGNIGNVGGNNGNAGHNNGNVGGNNGNRPPVNNGGYGNGNSGHNNGNAGHNGGYGNGNAGHNNGGYGNNGGNRPPVNNGGYGNNGGNRPPVNNGGYGNNGGNRPPVNNGGYGNGNYGGNRPPANNGNYGGYPGGYNDIYPGVRPPIPTARVYDRYETVYRTNCSSIVLRTTFRTKAEAYYYVTRLLEENFYTIGTYGDGYSWLQSDVSFIPTPYDWTNPMTHNQFRIKVSFTKSFGYVKVTLSGEWRESILSSVFSILRFQPSDRYSTYYAWNVLEDLADSIPHSYLSYR